MIFCVTFGQQYAREPHPRFEGAHPDGWVEIEADNEVEARRTTIGALGTAWSNIYPWADFADDGPMYPLGCITRFGPETEGT